MAYRRKRRSVRSRGGRRRGFVKSRKSFARRRKVRGLRIGYRM